LASMCVPMYIAEVAPMESRGILVTINNCAITMGQLLASIVAGLFSHDHVDGWRYMLGIAAVPAIIQFFAFLFMPESPRWLVAKGRYEDALSVLKRVRTTDDDIQEEFRAIQEDCQENQLANVVKLADKRTKKTVYFGLLKPGPLIMKGGIV
ncbi:Proton myo-inositol cotransporter, partial [Araneus ventricosus]